MNGQLGGKPFYVLALNYNDALAFTNLHNIDRRRLVYLNTPEKIRGIRNVEVNVADGAKYSDNYYRLIEVIQKRPNVTLKGQI